MSSIALCVHWSSLFWHQCVKQPMRSDVLDLRRRQSVAACLDRRRHVQHVSETAPRPLSPSTNGMGSNVNTPQHIYLGRYGSSGEGLTPFIVLRTQRWERGGWVNIAYFKYFSLRFLGMTAHIFSSAPAGLRCFGGHLTLALVTFK